MTMTSLGMRKGGVALGTCGCWHFRMSTLARHCGSSPVNTVGRMSESITRALLSAISGAHEHFRMGTLHFGTLGVVHLLGSVGTNVEVGEMDLSDPGLALRAHVQVSGLEH